MTSQPVVTMMTGLSQPEFNARISVVIPAYNAEKYLKRSIGSALGQSLPPLEVIVVNDGSSDGSASLVESLGRPEVRLINQANQGVSVARNRGIEEARGEFIAFLDADDEWLPNFLERMARLIELFPDAGIYAAGYRVLYPVYPSFEITITEESPTLIHDYFDRILHTEIVSASSCVIPKKVFNETGGFLAGELSGQDIEMWARILLNHPLAYDPDILACYHLTPFDKKPKKDNAPAHCPRNQLLWRHLLEHPEKGHNNPCLREVIRQKTLSLMSLFANARDWDRVARLMNQPESSFSLPFLSRHFHRKLVKLGILAYAINYRFRKSRHTLRFIGGKFRSHHVIRRICQNH